MRTTFLLALAGLMALSCTPEGAPGTTDIRRDLFVVHSAVASREFPALVERHLDEGDLVRVDASPPPLRVSRDASYALPTALRRRWAGDIGVRGWTERRCREAPRTIVYDPERRPLTPPEEQADFVRAIATAVELIRSKGCHDVGLAPGATPFFGLDPIGCSFDMDAGFIDEVAWSEVDLVQIQAQRLLGDDCADEDGASVYRRAIEEVADLVRAANPGIRVVAQISFRDSTPERMLEGLASVQDLVDGVFYSYPDSPVATIPCEYCNPDGLERLLENLR